MDEWAKKRLAELEAAAPVKRKKVKPFVAKIELDTAAEAFAAKKLWCGCGYYIRHGKPGTKPSLCLTVR